MARISYRRGSVSTLRVLQVRGVTRENMRDLSWPMYKEENMFKGELMDIIAVSKKKYFHYTSSV